jgi:GNAT superfamily N-acetyltransferase
LTQVPADIIWQTLTGRQAHFSVGGETARRYAPGFSPIISFANIAAPDFAALTLHCSPGETFYTDGWTGLPTGGWEVEEESTMFKMIWDAPLPPEQNTEAMVRLGPQHAEEALRLAQLTNPGPFGIRTLELGEYFGYFDGTNLVAMTGERMDAGDFREVSGVCTHPDFLGRGYASTLIRHVVRRQMQRNQNPFLHVMSQNPARALYKKLGFRDSLESVVRVIAPPIG